jgi:GGDEF domain-containing protein/tetratricopeptide (TPR) repeat protein
MLDLGRRSDKSDIGKRREKAEKLLQKGKTSAALEEYVSILRDDPGNDVIRQTAADVYLSINCNKEAAALLGELFRRQVDAGDRAKAVLTYKKLVRFSSPTPEQTFRYATFIERTHEKEALDAYEAALAGFTAERNHQKAMAALERIVGLDATQQNYWRAAELAVETGDTHRAGAYLLAVGELEENSGGNCGPWYERAYKMDSANSDAALAYGRTLVNGQQFAESLQVLQPLMAAGYGASSEVCDVYSRALLGAGRLSEAAPLVWTLFEQNADRKQQVADLIGALIEARQDKAAVELARKLDQYLRRHSTRREFIVLMKDLVEKHPSSSEMLEYLVELFNSSNRETEYAQTLIKLYELYYASGNYQKASDCLDRAAEVDAYEAGHQKRLERLKGKIEEQRYKSIAHRFAASATAAEQQPTKAEQPEESSVLQDLVLQAEILVQYGMRAKAMERLQRIQQLFPREEERNDELRRLYLSVGIVPTYPGSATSTVTSGATTPVPVGPSVPAVAPLPEPSTISVPARTAPNSMHDDRDVEKLTRVTDITRKMYQQVNVKAVLTTAVQEIGALWQTTRCFVALRVPGKPPSLLLEHCGPGVPAANMQLAAKLFSRLSDMAIANGVVIIPDAAASPELGEVRDAITGLDAESLLAVPLVDGQEYVGGLMLQHTGNMPDWHGNDLLVLKNLADQMVIALHNARLRRLVNTLSGGDEKSGLLKRASYFDVLTSEVRRSLQQNTPATVMLLEYGRAGAMVKEFGQEAVERYMRHVAQELAAHIRQSDIALQYDLTTVALFLADTAEKGAYLALDKLRRVTAEIHLPGRDTGPTLMAGIAEAVMRPQFDPADIVTELVNRADMALEGAHGEATRICALTCPYDLSAVA